MLADERLVDVWGQHWLILAAADGRRRLDEVLVSRGARVHRLFVYQRRNLDPTDRELQQLLENPVWITLLASGGALERLSSALPTGVWGRLKAGRMIVPSKRLQGRAGELGVAGVILSDGASDEAMVSALKRCTPPA